MTKIQFTDGAAYERYMGKWSQLAGGQFLDWLKPAPQQQWLDVGCGNGAFTQLIVDRCAPSAVIGVDPSAAQLQHARERFSPAIAQFHEGNAMALPLSDGVADVAVMPLVIFFVPVPERGVAEMVRVVRVGGLVTAYAWDMQGVGFPYVSLQDEMARLGYPVPQEPSPEASRADVLHRLWVDAGLGDVAVREFSVQRTFEAFADDWDTILGAPSAGPALNGMPAETLDQLQSRLRDRLPADDRGRITYSARANAVRGVRFA